MFKDLKKDPKIQADSDNIGGYGEGSNYFESGIYSAIIDVAYMLEAAAKGTKGVAIHYKVGNKMFRNTLWICSAQRVFTWEKNGKTGYWPGYTLFDEICHIVTGKDIEHLPEPVMKTLNVWDPSIGGEQPTEVPVVMPLQGGMLQLGIIHTLEDHYRPEHKTKWVEKNELNKVFYPNGFTVTETITKATDPLTKEKWLEKYGGNTIDKRADSLGGSKYSTAAPKEDVPDTGSKDSLFSD